MSLLSSNDYLGLSFHPKVIEACRPGPREWIQHHRQQAIPTAPRPLPVELEEKARRLLGREACHIKLRGTTSTDG